MHTGLIARNFGDIYDVLFESRLTADYVPVPAFTPEQATKLIADAEKFVGEMERLAR